MARTLAQFTVKRSGEDYILTLEDQDGEKVTMTADYEQLDLITEAIETQLDADEEDDSTETGDDDGDDLDSEDE